MLDALYIAATGMQAQQLSIDTVANNLANVNTPGFKKGRVTFTDLVAREALPAAPAGQASSAAPLASTPALGAGVGVSRVTTQFEPGERKQTNSMFDVAIDGDGFLEVAMPDGSRAFTRGGTLRVATDGTLTTAAGYPLHGDVRIPSDATSFAIARDGHVLVSVPSRSTAVDVGQLELTRFANPTGLTAQGDGLYRATDDSGEPIAARPGEDGAGALVQGSLEASNVKLVDEMLNLMLAQRAYEASVKVLQASDEMLGLVNALRK